MVFVTIHHRLQQVQVHMKLVQRVIYKYDAGGKRSKPLIISLNPNAASIAPTLGEDAARIHQEMSKQR